jgi:signal transduction histidine kinase
MRKNFIFIFLTIILLVSTTLIYYSHLNFKQNVEQRYSSLSNKLYLETKTLIEQKKEATLLLALSLAKDNRVKEAILSQDHTKLSLKEITDTYTTYTTFKNVWIHLISANGVSFMKSWTDRRGESILDIRKDVVAFLKNPRVKSLVSVGKYDMTIKAMVPIYDGDKLIGLFEVITKMDSIVRELSKAKILPIVLVDKKYKKQLRHAYTNTFIQDYYMANIEVNPRILEFTQQINLEHILQNKDEFQIIKDKFLTIYHLKDVHNEEMGYFLLYKDLENIAIDDLKSKQINFVLIWLGIISILVYIFLYLLNKNYTNTLQQEIYKKTKELKIINENLQETVHNEIEKNRQNEIKLFQQEKLLHIAQMFQNIAHHWRQPLSIITTSLSGLNFRLTYETVSQSEIQRDIEKSMKIAEELSENIDFFSKSYNDEKQDTIQLQSVIESAIKVLRPILDENNIQVISKYDKLPIKISYNKTKFINMLVTILQNAYESLIQTQNQDKTIIIYLTQEENLINLSIEDNGLGIPQNLLDKIFEPYTTTKHQSKGVGLSLYFAHNMIIHDFKGTIEAINTELGAKVSIKIPLKYFS